MTSRAGDGERDSVRDTDADCVKRPPRGAGDACERAGDPSAATSPDDCGDRVPSCAVRTGVVDAERGWSGGVDAGRCASLPSSMPVTAWTCAAEAAAAAGDTAWGGPARTGVPPRCGDLDGGVLFASPRVGGAVCGGGMEGNDGSSDERRGMPSAAKTAARSRTIFFHWLAIAHRN